MPWPQFTAGIERQPQCAFCHHLSWPNCIAGSEPQPPSAVELIQQLRQKLAVHLPTTLQNGKLKDGCLLLQVAAAHGKEDVLPAAQHRFTEADLVCQVIICIIDCCSEPNCLRTLEVVNMSICPSSQHEVTVQSCVRFAVHRMMQQASTLLQVAQQR